MEDGGWRFSILDPRSSTRSAPCLSSILDPRSSILHPQSSTLILLMLVAIVVPTAMFGVAEDQRLDHDRNRLGVGQFLADIDEVKVF